MSGSFIPHPLQVMEFLRESCGGRVSNPYSLPLLDRIELPFNAGLVGSNYFGELDPTSGFVTIRTTCVRGNRLFIEAD